ncbi:HIT family protein [Paenibacillus endoradicis]|uniref:HIT family protein n=1 Tax=Paenibacillus endoradicis TaxID=2972487 RepID=UPI0021592304|nr:HIT family protein [Paenibacillus endoradicis]MCR8656421.1 HIT family protein [Paenibacillus endoradicis]
MSCLGCQLANGKIPSQIVYENELVTCILDIAPLNDGHSLILPKKHYSELDEIDEQTLQAIMVASVYLSKAIKSIYMPSGVSIMQNGGSFNDLDHYHMHIFPRYIGDGFGWTEPTNLSLNNLETVKQLIMDHINQIITIN